MQNLKGGYIPILGWFMKKYYLAIDIGASSGRHILGHLEEGKMVLEEIHRFPNGNIEKDGELVWDIDGLYKEILIGMRRCKEAGKIPVSVGIDTWAEVAAVIYNSLAKCYGKTIAEIETITGKYFDSIHIVGGGSNAEYLNQLTALVT